MKGIVVMMRWKQAARAALQFARQTGAMGGETGIFKTDWWGDISTSPSPANLSLDVLQGRDNQGVCGGA